METTEAAFDVAFDVAFLERLAGLQYLANELLLVVINILRLVIQWSAALSLLLFVSTRLMTRDFLHLQVVVVVIPHHHGLPVLLAAGVVNFLDLHRAPSQLSILTDEPVLYARHDVLRGSAGNWW